MRTAIQILLLGVTLVLSGQHAHADLPRSNGCEEVRRSENHDDAAPASPSGPPRFLEEPSYLAFFFVMRICAPYAGVYLIERNDGGVAGDGYGTVVEAIRGPWREQVRLGPIARELTSSRLIVYMNDDGVPSDESPLILEGIPLPGRHPATCHPHPEGHPLTLYTRAMVRFWETGEVDVQQVFDLLSSEELPEVWAGCDMRLRDLPRDRVEDWDRIGAFLSQGLAIGGVVQQRLDRPRWRRSDASELWRYLWSGDLWSSRCHGELLMTLQDALLTIRNEAAWRQDAIRVLVDAASHEDPGIRSIGCSLIAPGFSLACDAQNVSNPSRMRQVRESLGMPAEPRERTMWHDRDIHPERHVLTNHASTQVPNEAKDD